MIGDNFSFLDRVFTNNRRTTDKTLTTISIRYFNSKEELWIEGNKYNVEHLQVQPPALEVTRTLKINDSYLDMTFDERVKVIISNERARVTKESVD